MLILLQVEQFIEVIFPTQNPKAAVVVAQTEEAAQSKQEENKDLFYLAIAVVGTLVFITTILV